ncbi:rod shape-determining protein MreC [Alicycliphilus denitrificans]|uniref:rod shape-determining protein MreC n=1 Tax=Alicycliphilus denitrificans TaxID=179636 RepID=UPI00095E598B|nr:rod shape-determining protein MreC [Alicycliphilus denitrificans]MBN9575336.1 rod shape-determining protein MreC [Alicycliphilus denitrificans]OJW93111.1 MAG: rod shape-determining protein MreC [Alicycliphilus sp. 69-12]BCN37051.1 rod shape-determining protein MreC [Alicycliphilus denitrificans]
MPLGTLDRTAPTLFKHGPSPLSRLTLYSALALFLMVADARFHVAEPLRKAVATVLYPLQWLMLQPVELSGKGAQYFQSLQAAQQAADEAGRKMAQMSVRAGEADQLLRENAELRRLLALRERLDTPAQAAQVLYDTADPYTRRIMVDRGQLAGVEPGSPVVDAAGVLGQVTRVYPMLSEVTLLIDRDQAIPVLNLRTGARSVAYGDPLAGPGGGMELRFTPANADVQEGDLLTTSGVDGLYPAGLPVARVLRVERRADSAFARIYCAPLAQVHGARHVMVLKPLAADMPARPEPEPAQQKRGGRK